MSHPTPISPAEQAADSQLTTTRTVDLDATEAVSLADCETTIERGRRSFIDVGNALATIRDEKLYRVTHGTFEAYCKQRWQIGRNYANKQIAAAKVVKTLGTTVPILPTAETQIRPLLEFDEADQPKVWEKVVTQIINGNGDSRAITTRQITDAIEHEIRKSEDEPFQKVKARREALAKAANKGTDGRPHIIHPATSAMQFAQMAILQLVRIRPDDPARDKAFSTVEKWIQDHAIPASPEDLEEPAPLPRPSDEQIGEMVGPIGEDTNRAQKIIHADPVLASRIDRGEVTLDEATASLSSSGSAPTPDVASTMSVAINGNRYQVEKHCGVWMFRLTPEAGWTAASPEMVLQIERQICPRGGPHEADDDGDCRKCGEPGIVNTEARQ